MNGGYALDAWHFLLPKEGCSTSECEDAVAEHTRALRFAIADGATEGFDSRAWARLLVGRWLRVDPPAITAEDFQPLVRFLGLGLHGRWQGKALPWYAEEKAKLGSFAAFLGIQFFIQQNQLSWKAIALGDCCLVHQRDSKICAAFPISESESFGSHPVLVPSLGWLQEKAFAELKVLEGTAEEGDEFLLLSDAIAAWYLRKTDASEQERGKLRSLLKGRDREELEKLVRNSRHQGTMRNDDVVALRIAAVRS
jgi:hypothetical protein